ncbi:hypothetical protein Cgig2_004473 [Carnegiea gigantea]|uniref:Uncharacterized protein n=1 Tax=Carnegiea gigantea TaxID=171969 RepID=A0A9Q1GJ61_9CARY|nr:hypothetical protein Cgig2_004473 [Carnegiea gigantea]
MNLGIGRGLSSSRTSPQPDPRRRKRKSYFQYFSFDFFSIAVMKPVLLLKQYHPKSSISLGPFCTLRAARYTTIHLAGARPVRLGTDPTGPDNDLVGELVEAPSEDELRKERPEAGNGDLPRVRHLHLRAMNAGGGGVLGNGIGNRFRLPTLILSGDASHHMAINKGWEARELLVPTLHLGASLPLTDVPTGRAR